MWKEKRLQTIALKETMIDTIPSRIKETGKTSKYQAKLKLYRKIEFKEVMFGTTGKVDPVRQKQYLLVPDSAIFPTFPLSSIDRYT